MRQVRLAVVAGLIVVMGWTLGVTAASTTESACASGYAERFPRYEWALGVLRDSVRTFQTIASLASAGLAAPDVATLRGHVQEIAVLLEGLQKYGTETWTNEPGTVWGVPYLLGEGGLLEQLAAALDSYMGLAESCIGVLADYYETQCLQDWGAENCWEGVGRALAAARTGSFSDSLDRATALGELALRAALRIAPEADPDMAADELLSIYAYAAAAGGFPMVVTLEPGDEFYSTNPSEESSQEQMEALHERSEQMKNWSLENVPSALGRLFTRFRQLDQDLTEAVAAAQGGG